MITTARPSVNSRTVTACAPSVEVQLCRRRGSRRIRAAARNTYSDRNVGASPG
jgi:hypothetical protein